MTDVERLQRMIDDLRRLRNSCEPKNNQNPRYLRGPARTRGGPSCPRLGHAGPGGHAPVVLDLC
jgi:hypothetical protein